MTGKPIELFLADGVPGGVTTANVAGWTGSVLLAPRAQTAEILRRPETQGNGTYLLLGDDPEAVNNIRCYVGKTENYTDRFRQHDAKKDFWDRLVVITSTDDSFNEGHWGYLEARLHELATVAQRCSLENTQQPKPRKFSEAQASDMEAFIEQLLVVLPVLGVNVIRKVKDTAPPVPSKVEQSPLFTLDLPKRGIKAHARVDGDEFVMLKDSIVVPAWTSTGSKESTRRSYAAYKSQFDGLVADGSILVEADHGRLTRDVPFSSPSGAGAIALGRMCNGKQDWRWSGGTYAQWQDQEL